MEYPDQHELSKQALHAEITRLNKIIYALMNSSEQNASSPIPDSPPLRQMTPIGIPVRHTSNEMEAMLLESEIIIRNLRESEVFFRQLFERHNAIMLLIDYQSGTIVDANPAAAQFYGYPLESLRGMKVSRINAQHESEIHQQRQLAINGDQNRFVFDHCLANGEVRAVEVHISIVNYKDKSLFFSIIHDITERKQMEDQIRQLAFYDALTNLPNRRLLNDRLSQAMAASKRSEYYGALIFLDLDNFKTLNDMHGHPVGDLLLFEAARRLESCLREMDTVARFGGDEFVIMLAELHEDKALSKWQAAIVAEKIRATLSEPYLLAINNSNDEKSEDTIEHCCTASIGVVLFIDHESNLDNVMKWADAAMYEAKEAGRNQVRFYDEKC